MITPERIAALADAMALERLIDRDKLWGLFVDHYWDTLQKDRDLILCHVESVLRMIQDSQQLIDTR